MRPAPPPCRAASAVAHLLALAALAAVPPAASAQEAPQQKPPVESGLTEEVTSALVLLDMPVRDRKGRPVPGLTADDFEVFVGGKLVEPVAVDDLCGCAAHPLPAEEDRTERSSHAGAAVAPPPQAPAPGGVAAPADVPAREPSFVVLFLDFMQLDVPDRFKTVREARRLVERFVRAGDRVMIVGSGRYLKTLAGPTGDRDALFSALDRAIDDEDLADDFPRNRASRLEECLRCLANCPKPGRCRCVVCDSNALAERRQTASALERLRLTIRTLESIPGPKALVYVNSEGVLFPSRLYPATSDFIVGDLIAELERVGAAAAASRVSLYSPSWAWSDLAANLADLSGGGKLADLEREWRSGCRCLYRISIAPASRRKLLRITVKVPRLRLERTFRVERRTDADRWRDRVLTALSRPEDSQGLPAALALLPTGREGRRWRVAIGLRFDAGSLEATDRHVSWGAGVRLERESDRRTWSYEGFADAVIHGESRNSTPILHETSPLLAPGRYEARGYVGDKQAVTVAGMKFEVTLPEAGVRSIIGPVLLLEGRPALLLPLPEEGHGPEHGRPPRRVTRGLPLLPRDVRPGAEIAAISWLCAGEDDPEPSGILRYVSRDGRPAYRLAGDPPLEPDGHGCFRLSDRFRLPEDLAPEEDLRYHVRWPEAALSAEAAFPVEEAGERRAAPSAAEQP